ncbi:hypothetical protein DERP_002923 [Dermatophagoides pteronyssinus]|uniref:Uncharacterized protein n=1 Tax=Dermatophagoides pteronyssinus TaxID=6956 RepID=A0ABQ8JW38_DERPT|nr:hypothetical protein DERP_002923 [Dermatophagoides pteronyssinus]
MEQEIFSMKKELNEKKGHVEQKNRSNIDSYMMIIHSIRENNNVFDKIFQFSIPCFWYNYIHYYNEE